MTCTFVVPSGRVETFAYPKNLSALLILVHLQPFPLFNEAEFPDLHLIEIIPSRPIAPRGPLGHVSGLIDLSPRRVEALFELGRNDAREQLERVWRRERIARIAYFGNEFRREAARELDDPL